MELYIKEVNTESIRVAVFEATGDYCTVEEWPLKSGYWGQLTFHDGRGSINFQIDDGIIRLKTCEFCCVLIDSGTRCCRCWECATRLETFVRSPAARVFVWDTLIKELLELEDEVDGVIDKLRSIKKLRKFNGR